MNARRRRKLVLLTSTVMGMATSIGSSACYPGIGGDSCDSDVDTAVGKHHSRQSVNGTFSRTFEDGARRDFLGLRVHLREQDIRTPLAIWLRVTIARPDDAGVHPWDGGADPYPGLPTEGIATVMRLRYGADSCPDDACNIEIDVFTCHSPRQWMKEIYTPPSDDVDLTCWDVSGATLPPLSWTTSGTIELAKPSKLRQDGYLHERSTVTVNIPREGNPRLYGHATITAEGSRECL